MRKRHLVAAIALSMGAGLTLAACTQSHNTESLPAETVVVTVTPDAVPQCPTEDYTPSEGACYWDATAQGNGTGDSFTVYSDGTVIYD